MFVHPLVSPGSSCFINWSYFFPIATGIALCWIAWRMSEYGRWRYFFGLWAVVTIYPRIPRILDLLNYEENPFLSRLLFEFNYFSLYGRIWWLPLVVNTMFAIILWAVVRHDVRNGPRRDWLHWLGVGLLFWKMITLVAGDVMSAIIHFS